MEPPRLHERSLQCHPPATSNSAIPINRAAETSRASDRHKGAPALSAGKITTMIEIPERRNAPAQTSSVTHTRRPMAAETEKTDGDGEYLAGLLEERYGVDRRAALLQVFEFESDL